MITLAAASCILATILFIMHHNEHKKRAQLEEEYGIACDLGDAIEKAARNQMDNWHAEHKEIREKDRTKYNRTFDELTETKADLLAALSAGHNEKRRLDGELRKSHTEINSLKGIAKADTARWDHLEKDNDKLKAEVDELSERLRCAGNPYSIESFDPDLPQRFSEPYDVEHDGYFRYIGRWKGQFDERDCWLGEMDRGYLGRQFVIATINEPNSKVMTPCFSYVSDIDSDDNASSYHQSAVEAAYRHVKVSNMLPRNSLPKDRNDLIYLGQSEHLDCWFSKSLPSECFNAGKPGVCLVGTDGSLCGWCVGGLIITTKHYKKALTFAIERGLMPEEHGVIFDPDVPTPQYEKPGSDYIFENPKFVGQYKDASQNKEYDCWLSYHEDNWRLVLTLCDGNESYWDTISTIRPKANSDKFVNVCESLKDRGMVPQSDPPEEEYKPVFVGRTEGYDTWFVKFHRGDSARASSCYPAIYITGGLDYKTRQARMTMTSVDERYREVKRPAAVAICKGYDLAVEHGLYEKYSPDFKPNALRRYEKPDCVFEHPKFVGRFKEWDCWLSYGPASLDVWKLCLSMTDGTRLGSTWVAIDSIGTGSSHQFIAAELGLQSQGMLPRTKPPSQEAEPVFLGQVNDHDAWFVKSNKTIRKNVSHTISTLPANSYPAIYVTGAKHSTRHRKTIANISQNYRNESDKVAKAICDGCDLAMERGLVLKDAVEPVMTPSGVDYPGNRDKPRYSPPDNTIQPEFLGCVGDYDAWIVKSGAGSHCDYPAIVTVNPGGRISQVSQVIGAIGNAYRSWACDSDHPEITAICKGLDLAIEQGHVEGKFTFPKHGTPSGHENLTFLARHDKFDVWLGKANGLGPYIVVFGNYYNMLVALPDINDKSYRADKAPGRIAACKGYDLAVQRNLISKEEPTQDKPRHNPPSDQTDPVFLVQRGDYDVWFVKSMTFNYGDGNNTPGIFITYPYPNGKYAQDYMPCGNLGPGASYRGAGYDYPKAKAICAGYDLAVERNLIS